MYNMNHYTGAPSVVQPEQRGGILLRAGAGGGDCALNPRSRDGQPRGLGPRRGRHTIQR